MQPTPTSVPGLQYRAGYLSLEEQEQLLEVIDSQPWITDLRRRVQHYGYRYNYTRRSVGADAYLGPLPEWAALLATRLQHDGFVAQAADQVIVNDYAAGQGISGHVDCVPCFGDTILSLSLASTCIMVFARLGTQERCEVLLEPGSLVVMQGEARYTWKHSIPARQTDLYQGRAMQRGRRVSLTFRTIIPPDGPPRG